MYVKYVRSLAETLDLPTPHSDLNLLELWAPPPMHYEQLTQPISPLLWPGWPKPLSSYLHGISGKCFRYGQLPLF